MRINSTEVVWLYLRYLDVVEYQSMQESPRRKGKAKPRVRVESLLCKLISSFLKVAGLRTPLFSTAHP